MGRLHKGERKIMVELTFLRLFKILWAYFWRSTVYMLIGFFSVLLAVSLLGLGFAGLLKIISKSNLWHLIMDNATVLSSIIPDFGAYGNEIFLQAIMHLVSLPFLMKAFDVISHLSFRDFRIQFPAKIKKAYRTQALTFWWQWWWRSVVIVIPIELLLYMPWSDTLSEDLAPIMVGADLILTVVIDLLVLNALLRGRFGDYKMILAPKLPKKQRKRVAATSGG